MHNLVNLIEIYDEEETPIRELGVYEGGLLFIEKMKELYNSEGIFPLDINYEILWRGMTELCRKDGKISLFRLTHDENSRIIMSVSGVLRRYPSWLKPLCFAYIKEVLARAAREGAVSLDVMTEKIMRGLYNG